MNSTIELNTLMDNFKIYKVKFPIAHRGDIWDSVM
jgi:hypothetical protein